MFTGLSAFSLTPFRNQQIDFDAFEKIIVNLTKAKVDSICAMGSTGLYPYLSFEERVAVTRKTVALAEGIPVMVGIGALRTADVLRHAEAAQQAGVDAVLLAPVSYHPLHEEEVFSLYETVCEAISVPLCVYDNPGVTQCAVILVMRCIAKWRNCPMLPPLKFLACHLALRMGSSFTTVTSSGASVSSYWR